MSDKSTPARRSPTSQAPAPKPDFDPPAADGTFEPLLGLDSAVINGTQRQRQILRMQATLGNAYVKSYLSRRMLQRAWSDARQSGARTSDKTVTAPQGGWNAGEALVGGVRRIPIEGLTHGNQDAGRMNRYGNKVSTSESAAGRAVVLIPQGIDPAKPVEVLFHLHGFNEGYRQHANGTVDDVEVFRIEQQLQAVAMQGPPNAEGQPTLSRQLIAVMPQLGTQSQFGDKDAQALLGEVFQKLNDMSAWGAKVSGPTSAQSVIMSAHSGGGGQVASLLGSPSKMVKNLHELILFDAMNGDGQEQKVEKWLLNKLNDEKSALDALAQNGGSQAEIAAQQLQYAQSGFVFRGYYSQSSYYKPRYITLENALKAWFKSHAAALGGEQSPVYQQ
ncbi:MAG: hypothetical protein U0694_29270, partial [Anaerolineae bacterium]